MAVIDFPIIYIPNPTIGKPLFNGKIFVGEPDLDPETNPKQLSVIQEDGTQVNVTQPFILSSGGVPVYNGSAVRLSVEGNYSIRIRDKNDAQAYYVENVFSSVVDDYVDNYNDLRALPSAQYTDGFPIHVTDDGIAGTFIVRTGTVTQIVGIREPFTDDSNRYAERSFDGDVHLSWLEVSDSVDSVTECQSAIDYTTSNGLILRWSNLSVLVKSSLTLYPNTRIYLPVDGGLLTSFGMAPRTGGVNFVPTLANDDLFVFAALPSEIDYGFYTNISVKGLWLIGDSANARYAFYLDHVIDSTFSFGAQDFVAGSYHDGTINNTFERCTYSDMSSVCVFGRNISTTDVFDTCRFQQSLYAFDSVGSIGFRFVNCLFEQLNNYAAVLSNTCRGVIFDQCYSEDVPFLPTVPSADSAVFLVGDGAGSAQTATSLIVTGGTYSGQNSATIGSLLRCDYMNGAIFSGIEANRFTQLFKTTANTSDRSILCAGIGGISWSLTTDTAKIQGMTPGAAQFSSSGLPHNAYLNVVYSSTHRPKVGSTNINIDADSLTVRQVWTDTRTANTNTPSGATVSSMPVYSSSGTLIGYMPIYAAQW